MKGPSFDHPEAIAAAMGVLDRHLAAPSLLSLRPGDHRVGDHLVAQGNEWHRSACDFRNPISSSSDKVHLDVQFSRYRADGSLLGRYRSIWVVSSIDQRWAAQLRSSFAA